MAGRFHPIIITPPLNGGTCVVCGGPLRGKQKLYCGQKCAQASAHRVKRSFVARGTTCVICGATLAPGQRRYCSHECAGIGKTKGGVNYNDEEEKNRPYTQDTAFLIRKWSDEGMSIKDIADLLHRSEANVLLAFKRDDSQCG